uniref:Uncharacterized protein n=1 Tax=Gopherus agassizii TaxID=38772 RepID=A0A452I8J2_9SAUR
SKPLCTGGCLCPGFVAMAVKVSHWHSYQMEHFQKAENILLTVLEKITAMDPRFIADYSRNLEAFEFAVCTSEDAVTVGVPLWIVADALLLQECSSKQGQSETVTNGNHQMSGCCHLGVPKEGTGWENWTREDVFSVMGSAECRVHVVPGKILRLLKELIVAAIPGLYASCIHGAVGQGQRDPVLLVSSGWKMIRFNIIPVVQRKQGALKLHSRCREGGFPEGNLQKVTQWADFIPSSYNHWRYSTNHPVMKLLHIMGMLKGHHLDSLHLLDQVNSEHWKEEDRKEGLTFNHLKISVPSPEDWEDLERSVYQLLVILLCCLVTKNLPHFLYPEENLFQETPIHPTPPDHPLLGPLPLTAPQDPTLYLSAIGPCPLTAPSRDPCP